MLSGISGRHFFILLRLRQIGDGVNGRNFHGIGNGGCAAVQGSAENVRKAQDVVDLIRIIRPASGHDGVVAHLHHFFGGDFRNRVGQRKNQWPGRHAGHHFGLEHTARRKSQKHVGAINGLGQRALAGGLRVDGLVGIHQLGAAFVNQAFDVGHPDVLARQAQLDQQANAGQCCGAGAAGDQLDFLDFLTCHFQAIE